MSSEVRLVAWGFKQLAGIIRSNLGNLRIRSTSATWPLLLYHPDNGICHVTVQFWFVLCDCRVHLKPYVELKDSDGRPDEEVAHEVRSNDFMSPYKCACYFSGILGKLVDCNMFVLSPKHSVCVNWAFCIKLSLLWYPSWQILYLETVLCKGPMLQFSSSYMCLY